MKFLVSMFGIGLLVATLFASAASAQSPNDGYPAGAVAQGVTPFSTDIPVLLPGRYWLEANLVDNGLGYSGSFATLGSKLRLFEDGWNGRWLGEAQGHLALENGKFFGNIGIERVMSIDSAPADVSLGVFYDRDGADTGDFVHTFNQLSVSGKIKTMKGHLIANGYFPVGTQIHTLGDPTGQQCFLGNNILLQAGIDSALKGFDVELRLRPYWFSMVNGTLDIGGYNYGSDLIKEFGGVRIRSGMQTKRGGLLSATVNYDDRFHLTGGLQLGWQFGGRSGRGREQSVIGRDLDKTVRNAHIVRYNQDVEFLISPTTGLPYEVYHVDNTAAAGGDGTVERRFNMLASAETASATDDIIFVYAGDGSFNGYNTGITLKDRQLLLGDGVRHLIPSAAGGTFELCNNVDGNTPTLTNINNNSNIVTLADGNTVAGFTLEGNHVVNANIVLNGIFGASSPSGAIIRDNVIQNVNLDGVHLASTGDVLLTDNVFNNIGDDAVEIERFTGSRFLITGNAINGTGSATGILGDGFNIGSAGAGAIDGEETVIVRGNTFSNIGGHAFFFHNMLDSVAGTGSTFSITDNIVNGAGGNGFFFQDIADPLNTFTFRGNSVTNTVDGIRLERFDGATFLFDTNTTSNNTGNGLALIGYANTGAPLQVGSFTILDHTASANVLNGLFVDGLDGDFLLNGGTFTNNIGNGGLLNNLTSSAALASTILSANTFSNNNAGATAGLRINLDGSTATPIAVYDLTGNIVQNNNSGIITTVSGATSVLTVNIADFGQGDPTAVDDFTGHDLDTISFSATAGSTGTLNVTNSILDNNALVTGAVIRLLAADSTLTANVSGNSMTGIGGGQGIVATVTGDSNTNLSFDGNTVSGGVNDNITVNYAVTNTDVQALNISNNLLSTAGANGIRVRADGSTRLDAEVVANLITDPAVRGFQLIANDNTRVRLDLSANGFIDTSAISTTEHGVFVQTNDSAQLMGDIIGNSISNFGGDGVPSLFADNAVVPNVNWSQGMSITANDISTMGVNVDNNAVVGSALEGILIQASDSAEMIALVVNNAMFGNDVRTVVDTLPAIDVVIKPAGRFDFVGQTTGAVSILDIALNGNLATQPIAVGEFGGDGTVFRRSDAGGNSPNPSSGNFGGVPAYILAPPTFTGAFSSAALDAFDAGFIVP